MLKITVDLEAPALGGHKAFKISRELELARTIKKPEDLEQLHVMFKQLVDLQLDTLLDEVFDDFKTQVENTKPAKASKKRTNDGEEETE